MGAATTLESNNLVTFGGWFQQRRGVRTLWVMTDATLASATNSANRQLIDTLLHSRLFRDYESVFTKQLAWRWRLRPLEYWQLEHHQKTNENRFCALLSQRPATLAVCLQSHADIIRHTGTKPCTETCPFGLTETAVPVRLGEKTIGFLRIGQVLRRSAIQSDKARAPPGSRNVVCRLPAASAKRGRRRRLSRRRNMARSCGCSRFSPSNSRPSSTKSCSRNRTAEPLLVRKAREYIEQHKMEPLSLATVAQASGASVFHFCKVFKKTTGLTFTDYVGRVRLEDAKAQLLNPNRRISEIAYDVGFQSLTQFNRMFKRVFRPITH